MLHFLFCLGLASSSRLFKCLQYCLFIYTLTTLFVYAAIVDDVDDAYHALSGGCLDFTENRFFTVKRESAFNKLFNPNGQTDGILFVYKYDEHSHNIYHQMNWYLSHFHDIISSPALLSSLQRRSQCNHQPFTIHILFPHGHHLGYQWAVKLLESYPINMRWNGIQCFSEISIQCHFYTISSAEIDPQFIRKDDVRNLLERHSIPNCIKLNCRWPTLMEYRHSDWIIAHQPHYQWIAEWTAHYKSMYHINGRDAKLSNHSNDSNAPRKWKIGFIQRPEKRRYLRDLDTKMDLFQVNVPLVDS